MKAGRLLLTVVMAVVLAACGTPPDDPTPAVSATESPSTSPAPSVTPTTASPDPTPNATAEATPTEPDRPIADEPPALALETVATGLDAPINVAPLPDGRLLVNERAGRVRVVDPAAGSVGTALDITDRVLGQSEQGLLGLAVHPAWPDEPVAYIHYTDLRGRTVMSRFTATATDGPVLDPGSEEVLLTVDQPFSNHNGGQLAFGPDGYLYLGLGDGGAGGDPLGNGQNPETLLGTVLRLDVDGADAGRAYAVPRDNPFVAGGGAAEVLLYGLRNPWRFSFDRATGQLWIADVGQGALEEIDRVDPVADAGGNLGWSITEGSRCFTDAGCSTDGLIGPVTEYGRDLGCSVTGGYVYRGDAIADLAGWYLFGDYCTGIVFGVRSDVSELRPPRTLVDSEAAISAFGEDADGELYVADLNGALYRIVRG